jgi:hypothetical protein
MMNKLWNLLNPRRMSALGWTPALKDRVLFNGQLLDQNREDVYVVLHQMGVIR